MSKSSKRRGKGKGNRRAMRWVAHYHNEPVKLKSTGIVGWAIAGGFDLLRVFFEDDPRNFYYRQRDEITEVSSSDAVLLRLKGDLSAPPSLITKRGMKRFDVERLKKFLEKEKARNE